MLKSSAFLPNTAYEQTHTTEPRPRRIHAEGRRRRPLDP